MGQQQSTTAQSHLRQVQASPSRISASKFTPIEHEGLLKLRTVPFKNSVQVSTSPCLFMEKADVTLAGLLEDRYNTTKLFTQQDLTNLLQSVLYTLAYLETKNVVYLDLSTHNIFYDPEESTFKLYPAQIIRESGYEMALKKSRQSLLSPQMIIALRCHEPTLDNDFYHKSNMFLLGMIMLECGSLKPAAYCYDEQNLDILDKEIKDRLKIISEFYSERLLKYVTMLVEYDYTERIYAKDLALLFNRELTEDKVSRLKKVTGKDFSATKRNNEDTIDQGRKFDQQAAELARSHIDSLAVLNSTTATFAVPQQQSFRNHINTGSSVKQQITPIQSLVRESIALQPPQPAQNRKSVSPARIPGYKPHILSHHHPSVPPLRGLPNSTDFARPFENNEDREHFPSNNLARPTSSGFTAGSTLHRQSVAAESQPAAKQQMEMTGGMVPRIQGLPMQPRLNPMELAQRITMKGSGINQPPHGTPPPMRTSTVLRQAPMTSSFNQIPPPFMQQQQSTDPFNRSSTPPLAAPSHIRFNYIDVSQKYNRSQSDTYQQQSHSAFNSELKEQSQVRNPSEIPPPILSVSPLQKQSASSQQSSIYPTQFHLISTREPVQAPLDSEQSHSHSQSQDYSIAKIKEQIEKSRRLIQQLQNQNKPSPDRKFSPIQ